MSAVLKKKCPLRFEEQLGRNSELPRYILSALVAGCFFFFISTDRHQLLMVEVTYELLICFGDQGSNSCKTNSPHPGFKVNKCLLTSCCIDLCFIPFYEVEWTDSIS